MSEPDLTPLQEALSDRVCELEKTRHKEKKRNEGDGSTAATWKVVEPKIRKDVVENCLSDLEEVENIEEILEVLAEWRRNMSRKWSFKTTNSPTENNRNDIKRAEQEVWTDQLVILIPESEFRTCGICESDKMPKSDRRRRRGYEWECPECGI